MTNEEMVPSAETVSKAKIEELAKTIASGTEKPVLVLYYYGDMSIAGRQVKHLDRTLRTAGLVRSEPLDSVNVILHTMGGDPTAAYHLAQVVRDYATQASFLIPEYAYSAGTLMCLAGDVVTLGANAVLSPIDITVERRFAGERDHEPRFLSEDNRQTRVETVAIDHFIKAAAQARIEVEREFRRMGWTEAKSDADSAMLRTMVEQLGVLEIGKIYREKNIAQHYANQLLQSYMLKGAPHEMIDRVISRLVVDTPSHEFDIDYHLCYDIGLRVDRLTDNLSDIGQLLIQELDSAARQGFICVSNERPVPFFQYFESDPITPLTGGYHESETEDAYVETKSTEQQPHTLHPEETIAQEVD